jgi:hypothetical protein
MVLLYDIEFNIKLLIECAGAALNLCLRVHWVLIVAILNQNYLYQAVVPVTLKEKLTAVSVMHNFGGAPGFGPRLAFFDGR